jgi:hypothetical protein
MCYFLLDIENSVGFGTCVGHGAVLKFYTV